MFLQNFFLQKTRRNNATHIFWLKYILFPSSPVSYNIETKLINAHTCFTNVLKPEFFRRLTLYVNTCISYDINVGILYRRINKIPSLFEYVYWLQLHISYIHIHHVMYVYRKYEIKRIIFIVSRELSSWSTPKYLNEVFSDNIYIYRNNIFIQQYRVEYLYYLTDTAYIIGYRICVYIYIYIAEHLVMHSNKMRKLSQMFIWFYPPQVFCNVKIWGLCLHIYDLKIYIPLAPLFFTDEKRTIFIVSCRCVVYLYNIMLYQYIIVFPFCCAPNSLFFLYGIIALHSIYDI